MISLFRNQIITTKPRRPIIAVAYAVTKKSIARSLTTTTTTNNILPDVTLYQYNICPFCHKTKAILGYAGLQPKEIIEVNPLTKAELKFKQKDGDGDNEYRKVPIAFIEGKQVNGSDAIIHSLLQNDAVKESILSKSPSFKAWEDFTDNNDDDDTVWESFVNEDLAAILYPNICSSLGKSYTAFGYVHGVKTFSTLQKYSIQSVGSLAMYFAASRIKSKRGIVDEFSALQEALQRWQRDGLANGENEFSSGKDDPNLNDLLVYGILNSIDGLPTHEQIMNHPENTLLDNWYQSVKGRITV
mmetsp:Transcript_41354/g.47019  ORF Transcript_41354/g.47019 Transcript_41354/m.47019 type:complete len:300 (+) Transcript_41354:2-901(+)